MPIIPALANQLFACYARAVRVRVLASVMGEDSLPEVDRRFLAFGRGVRAAAGASGRTGARLEESMALGWELLRGLPVAELTRLKPQQIERYLQGAPHG